MKATDADNRAERDRDALVKKTAELERKLNEEVSEYKFKLETQEYNYNQNIEKMKKRITEYKEEYDRKLESTEFISKKTLTEKIEELTTKHEKEVENLKQIYTRNVASMKRTHEDELYLLKEENKELREKNSTLHAGTVKTIHERIKANEEKWEKIITEHKNESDHIIQKKEEAYEDLRKRTTTIISNLEKNLETTKKELARKTFEIKKVKEREESMNAQFIKNLNEQKLRADREIFARDNRISLLNLNIKKLGQDSVDAITRLETKLANTEEELEEVKGRYSNLKGQKLGI